MRKVLPERTRLLRIRRKANKRFAKPKKALSNVDALSLLIKENKTWARLWEALRKKRLVAKSQKEKRELLDLMHQVGFYRQQNIPYIKAAQNKLRSRVIR
jgi:hypothetical protein